MVFDLNSEFTTVRFTRNRIDDLRKLTRVVFKYAPSYEGYVRLFGAKDEYLGYITYHKETPVAFFGAIEMVLVSGSRIEKAAQPVNIMVHPGYRNLELFTILYQKLLELAKSESFVILFGWPSSELIFGKLLRWRKSCTMMTVRFKVKTMPYSKLFYKIPITKRIMRQILKLILLPHRVPVTDSVARVFSQNDGLEILRNKQFLDQKVSLGASVIKIQGKLIIVSADYRIKLGDMQSMSVEDFDRVVWRLKIIAFFLGMDEIITILNPESRMSKMILDKYPGSDSLSLMYHEINSGIVTSNLNFRFLDFDTF
jgi:hypothetical protein